MYYLNPDIQCKLFIKNLINNNENTILDIQTKIRNNQNVETQITKSLDFNLTQLNKNPCSYTFNKYGVKDFFSFYKSVFSHHKEQYLDSQKCRNRTFDILGFIDRFNYHLKDITTKLKT